MTTATPTENQLDYSRLVFKLDEELRGWHEMQESARNTIAASQAELEQIAAGETERHARLGELRTATENMTSQTTGQRNLAARAVDLPQLGKQEQKTLRELEKSLTRQRGLLDAAESKSSEEDQRDTARRAELTQAIEQAQADLVRAVAGIAEAEGVRRDAHARLGELERRDVLTHIEALKQDINNAQHSLLAVNQALETYLEQDAFPRLEEWPSYLNQLRPLRLAEDNLTHALSGEQQMLAALLADPKSISGIIRLPATFSLAGDPAQLLNIPLAEIQLWQHGVTNALQSRLALVSRFLDEYREQLQGRG